MATPATPVASAAPSAPASTAVPVSAPASTAPVTPAAPATPAAPVSTPSTSEAPKSATEIRAGMKERAIKALEAAEAESSASPANDETNIEVDGDQPVIDDTQQAATEDNPEEQQQTTEGEEEESGEGEFDLAPAGPLPPSELQAKLKANPGLLAELEKDPELKNSIFAASRLAQRTAEYDQQFPGGVAEAKIAAEGNKTFSNLSNLFTSVKDKPSTQNVLSEMMKLSYVLDDDGNPVVNQKTGKPQTDGTVGRFIEQTFGLGLDHWAQVAQQKGDDELAVAIDVLKARAFNTRTASAQEDLTEEQRATQQALDQQQKTLNEQQQAIETDKRTSFESKADDAYYKHMDSLLDRVMKSVGGTDEDKASMRAEIKNRVDTAIGQNPNFTSAQDLIWRRQGYGAKKLNDLTALGSQWINDVLPGIAREYLKSKGSTILDKQAATDARHQQRQSASSKEPQAGIRHSAPATMSTDQLHQKFREDFVAKNKRQPTTQEVLSGVRALRQGGVRTA